MSKKNKEASRPTCEEISALAYHLYEQEGRPSGRHVEHWLQAELLLNMRAAEEKAATARSSRPTEKKTATAAKMDRSAPRIVPQHQTTAAAGMFR